MKEVCKVSRVRASPTSTPTPHSHPGVRSLLSCSLAHRSSSAVKHFILIGSSGIQCSGFCFSLHGFHIKSKFLGLIGLKLLFHIFFSLKHPLISQVDKVVYRIHREGTYCLHMLPPPGLPTPLLYFIEC